MIKENILNRIELRLSARELELAMSKNDRQILKSRIAVIITHLLKWKYQPELRTSSWWKSIINQRRAVLPIVNGNSRKMNMTNVPDFLKESYIEGKKVALKEMKVSGARLSNIPTDCEWTVEQILDLNFFPDDDETTGSSFLGHRWY